MIEPWDKKLFDKYIRDHPIESLMGTMSEQEVDKTYETIDWLYHNKVGKIPMHEALDGANAVQVQKRLCEGNVWRSVETSYRFLRHFNIQKDEIDDKEGHDFQAALQNLFTSEDVQQDLEDAKDEQNLIESFTRGQSTEAYQPSGEMTDKDLEFRKWVYNEMRSNEDLKQIMDCFGKFYKQANILKREVYKKETFNVADTKLGNDISEVFEDELLGLVVPELNDLFLYNFAQEQLMQYDYKEKVDTGKGNISLLVDVSDSMNLEIGGYKVINIALGFACALAKFMTDEDRHLRVYSFSYSTRLEFDTRETTVQDALKKLMRIQTRSSTNLDKAVIHAFKESEDDVVMITDAIIRTLDKKSIAKYKGDRRLSTLLVADHMFSDSPLKEVSDSWIVSDGVGGFEHLTKEFM